MKKYFFTVLFSLLIAFTATAQEGMWLLSQIDDLDLGSKGLEIETSEIYSTENPSLHSAIIQLGGGTASFVSPDGLIITNHHVAFGALQRAATPEHDYITDGFTAFDRKDEIVAQGYNARLLLEMTDVTDEVLKAAKGITDPVGRDDKINEKMTKMNESAEKKKEDIDSRVVSMYNGKQYIQFIYKLFKDVRIVYAPPQSIGNYGGDIDNWMWPRHTGDFSFLRVYVSPEGNGAEYSEANVPYKPNVWLKAAKDDLKEGDFTFIMGFPGATTRYRTSNSAAWNLKYNYPFTIDYFGKAIDLMETLTENDPEGKIKVAGMKKGLANTMKNYQGKVDGMNRTNYVQDKIDFEKEFMTWVNSSPETKEKYGSILTDIKAQYAVIKKTKDRDNLVGYLGGLAGTELSMASYAYQFRSELEKPKKERKPGYTEETVLEIVEGLHYQYNNFYEPLDKALLTMALNMANDLPADQRIEGLEYIFTDYKSVEQFIDEAYGASKLDELEYAKSLFQMSVKEMEALNDPFVKMAKSMEPLAAEYDVVYAGFASNVVALRKLYIDAIFEWKGKTIYPDANSTLRFTSGNVMGYEPADAVWYKPFTSLNGMVQKNTGKVPFNAPEKLVKLSKKKEFGQWEDPALNDVPIAFLHQCDITGGNSGSPVMNAKGEIIGVAFDGNYEAMISDWQYDEELQRTISVDIRYVLFVTEKFGKAGFILDEMGVERDSYAAIKN